MPFLQPKRLPVFRTAVLTALVAVAFGLFLCGKWGGHRTGPMGLCGDFGATSMARGESPAPDAALAQSQQGRVELGRCDTEGLATVAVQRGSTLSPWLHWLNAHGVKWATARQLSVQILLCIWRI